MDHVGHPYSKAHIIQQGIFNAPPKATQIAFQTPFQALSSHRPRPTQPFTGPHHHLLREIAKKHDRSWKAWDVVG
jgi:hypothetical protein